MNHGNADMKSEPKPDHLNVEAHKSNDQKAYWRFKQISMFFTILCNYPATQHQNLYDKVWQSCKSSILKFRAVGKKL